MKISRVACTQFAGIRGLDLTFGEGVNVVCGPNESGKSTLVNLLSRTLFQDAQLDGRSSRGRDFGSLYYPSDSRTRAAGDFADGEVTLETEKGSYTLQKVWGADRRCVLTTPEGSAFRDQAAVNGILRQVLQYGEGVYSDLFFSSQKNMDTVLQTLLEAGKDTEAGTKRELSDLVSRAFAENAGISIDAIQEAIKAKVDGLLGKHWDIGRQRPQAREGRWQNSLGEVLSAYYDWQDAKEAQENLERLEEEVEQTAALYAKRLVQAAKAQEAYDSLSEVIGPLTAFQEQKKRITLLEHDEAECGKALLDWPRQREAVEAAKRLQTELRGRLLQTSYRDARTARAEMEDARRRFVELPYPTDEEVKAAKWLQNNLRGLENLLRGMNITLDARMFAGHTIKIRSLRTGELLETEAGGIPIREAVEIDIPGVASLRLAPANVDTEAVKRDLTEQRARLSDLLERYRVKDAEMLEECKEAVDRVKAQWETARENLDRVLAGRPFEELAAEAEALPAEIRDEAEIRRDIAALCGPDSLERFIGAREAVLAGYAEKYRTLDDLRQKHAETIRELERLRRALNQAQGVPEEYRAIPDPEAQLRNLKAQRDDLTAAKEAAHSAKVSAEARLEAQQQSDGVLAESAEGKKRAFEEAKDALGHWLHIQRVFEAKKEELSAHPMRDIAASFENYLGILSGGRVSSEFAHPDKVEPHIYSGNHLLDYRKLSEGTKGVVSLAFRLAVLDHLFPDGGGVLVLDDPCADMDPQRAAQTCALIRECAKRHQVIFLTCREEYVGMLGGHVARVL